MAGTSGLTEASERIVRLVDAALPDAPVVVALSGGADSAVLAWAISAAGRSVRAVTVDHGLPASPGLIDAARAVAGVLGVPHTVLPVAPASSEGDLRDLRYAALEDEAKPEEVVVTGHTADDQAETVLGNLLRGAGTAGLGGMPARSGRLLRPLLDVTRAQVREVAADLRLPFADDPDNVAAHRRRSRLRTETIPYLEERFNPAVRQALLRTGRIAAEDDRALEAWARDIPISAGPAQARVAAASLSTLPTAVASRVARRLLREVFSPHAGTAADVAAVLGVAGGAANRAGLSRGWLVEREGASVVLHPGAQAGVPEPVVLPVPGRVDFGAWMISAVVAPRPPVPRPLGRWTAVIPAGTQPLRVRAARPGETIPMHGGSKRVADALREAGVPVRLRRTWPVLERDGTMVWLVGARLAAGTAVGSDAPIWVLRAEVPS